MIGELEDNLIQQEVVRDYRKFAFESDEKLKGNLEAKKELSASDMAIEHTQKMLNWLNKELLRCE